MSIMVCVIYRQRALLLTWLVYKRKKGHTTTDRHIAVLAQLLPLIPTGAEVILLGDGEYDSPDLLAWIENQTDWVFVVRSAANVLITPDNRQYPLADLAALNTPSIASHVLFTAREFGPLHAIAWWIGYTDVVDIKASLKEMTNVGAEIVQDIKDVGNGLLIAQIKDTNGTVVGLRQQS